jgi:hypothetical protein
MSSAIVHNFKPGNQRQSYTVDYEASWCGGDDQYPTEQYLDELLVTEAWIVRRGVGDDRRIDLAKMSQSVYDRFCNLVAGFAQPD